MVGALSVLLVSRELRKEKVNFSLGQAVAIPFTASLLMALCLWPVASKVNGIPGLIGVVVLGAFLYLLFLFLLLRGKIKEEAALVKSLLPKLPKHGKN